VAKKKQGRAPTFLSRRGHYREGDKEVTLEQVVALGATPLSLELFGGSGGSQALQIVTF